MTWVAGTVGYSDDDIQRIAGCLREGLTASQIAEFISEARNEVVSRNAIIGVVHRNKVLRAIGFARASQGRHFKQKRAAKDHAKPATHAPGRQRKVQSHGYMTTRQIVQSVGEEFPLIDDDSKFTYAPPAPVALKPPANAAAYDAASRRVPMLSLGSFDCRFAVNDAGPGEQHLFCGLAADGGPYCRHHAQRAGAGYTAAEYRQRQVVAA